MTFLQAMALSAVLIGAAQARADDLDRACSSYRDRYNYYKENCPRERTREDRVDCNNDRLLPAQDKYAACIKSFELRRQGVRVEPQRQRPERY